MGDGEIGAEFVFRFCLYFLLSPAFGCLLCLDCFNNRLILLSGCCGRPDNKETVNLFVH